MGGCLCWARVGFAPLGSVERVFSEELFPGIEGVEVLIPGAVASRWAGAFGSGQLMAFEATHCCDTFHVVGLPSEVLVEPASTPVIR